MASSGRHRISMVRYAGDFREAVQRLAQGGAETYRAQRYAIEYLESLPARHDLTAITGFTSERYDEVLPSGVRAIGAGYSEKFDAADMIGLLRQTNPDRIILRLPDPRLLRWVVKSGIPTLALLADSFPTRTWKDRLKRFMIVRYLRAPNIQLVANHGRSSAQQLVRAGVQADKVVAWDFPALDSPHAHPTKTAPQGRTVVYAGLLSEAKGVGDLLRAAAKLHKLGRPIDVQLYGKGDTERLQSLANSLDLANSVHFNGLVPNDRIVPTMAAADLVVVPSRHEYSEGLPLTIYEALCSRTPLVASDHPMFLDNITDGQSCMMFPASDSDALADRIDRLLATPELYAKLSSNAPAAWDAIQIPLKWADVIENWLAQQA